MRTLIQDVKRFWSDRVYCLIVCLAAAGSYGFKISHVTIGIDDTCTALYFEDGLAPAVGRWALFLINKIFHLSQFTPWLTDLAGVIFLVFSATLWSVILWRIFGKEVPKFGYAVFAAIFLSCPLISEVFVYYLHNGIGIGYGLTAMSLLSVLEALKKGTGRKAAWGRTLLAAVFLTIAIGFYESFMMVYLIGGVLLFIAACMAQNDGYCTQVWRWGILGAAPVLPAMLLRSVLIKGICAAYGIFIPQNFTVKSRTGIFSAGLNAGDFFMFLKRYFVKYGLNFFVYLPITVLVAGTVILFLLCMAWGIRRKNFRPLLVSFLIPVLPAMMILIDGKESYYRASQYVPLIGAFAVLLLVKNGQRIRPGWIKHLGILAISAFIWNQCADMNRWFYMDYVKYEYFKTIMMDVSYDLGQTFDMSKPIVFCGECPVPRVVVENSRIRFDSSKYKILKSIGDLIDKHLIEKYNMSDGIGYVFVETPIASTIQWGITAFDGTPREIKNFAAMHGFDFLIETDLQKIKQANDLQADMPSFPKEGYIREFEDFIIVKF